MGRLKLRLPETKLSLKLFLAFSFFITVITVSFGMALIHSQSNSLSEGVVHNGRILSGVLAHNSRLGVFSENEELLRTPVDAIIRQKHVLYAAVYNSEKANIVFKQSDAVLKRKVKISTTIDASAFDELKHKKEQIVKEGKDFYSFWAPVLSKPAYKEAESLFFRNNPVNSEPVIIGFVQITFHKEFLKAEQKKLINQITRMGLTFLLFGLFVVYCIVKGFTRNLAELTRGVKAIGSGTFNNPLQIKSRDEIGKLARAYNEMAEAIRVRQKKLDDTNVWLEQRVLERTMELEESNLKLRREIDERTLAETALSKSESKYKAILSFIEEGYYECDLDGYVKFANYPLRSLLGFTEQEFKTHTVLDFTRKAYHKKLKAMLRDVNLTGRTASLMDLKISNAQGHLKVLQITINLNITRQGTLLGYRGVVRDITSHVVQEREKLKLERQLHRAQRLKSIGTLAGGVAHDFNNLLMGIQGNTNLIQLKMEKNDYLQKKLKVIEQCVESGANLTRQLLGFARGGKYVVTKISISALIMKALDIFTQAHKQVNIRGNFETDIWTTEGDESQLEQVLLNIFVNAAQAMDGKGDITVSVKSEYLGRDFVKPFDVPPGGYIRISISDTGRGMDKEILDRVFEPFFTTKEMGRGTGLGLASAFGIVKNHSGIIDAKSKVGIGSTFVIYLPSFETKKSADKEKETNPPEKVNVKTVKEQTILLVDDEELIISSCKPMLEQIGFSVITASCGEEALRIFDRKDHLIDIVILDMVMPDISGGEVFEAVKHIKPDIKVILSSGYSINKQAKTIIDQGCNAFLQKPYNMEQLSGVIFDLCPEVLP